MDKGLLDRLRDGEAVLSLGIRNARTTEIVRMARRAGFGMVWIDLEHSSMTVDHAAQIAATAFDLGIEGWVRTTERDWSVVGRLLDGGVTGIIAPRIETAEEARQLVSATRFPPRGLRSQIALLPQLGYRRVSPAELMRDAERATSVHALLESAKGIAAAEAIAAVEGLDILHVGVNDLSVDLGHIGDPTHHEVMEACLHVIAVAQRHGKLAAVGGLSDPAHTAKLLQAGAAPLIFAAIDTDLLATGLVQRAQECRTRLDAMMNPKP